LSTKSSAARGFQPEAAVRRLSILRIEVRSAKGESVKTLTLTVALLATAFTLTPVARAESLGNYELRVEGRYDFHTWLWAMSTCGGSLESPEGCVHVLAIGRPIAKAFNYQGDALLANSRYTLAVDVPDGLRCGDVYYGPVIPTHDVYSWDATTLVGTLESSFETGCEGTPGGTYTYPFTLSRL
jgi:hypothetical protein